MIPRSFSKVKARSAITSSGPRGRGDPTCPWVPMRESTILGPQQRNSNPSRASLGSWFKSARSTGTHRPHTAATHLVFNNPNGGAQAPLSALLGAVRLAGTPYLSARAPASLCPAMAPPPPCSQAARTWRLPILPANIPATAPRPACIPAPRSLHGALPTPQRAQTDTNIGVFGGR